jgi:hypothetical protein
MGCSKKDQPFLQPPSAKYRAVKTKAPPIGRGHEANLLLQDEVGSENVVTMHRDLEVRMPVAILVTEQDIVIRQTQLAGSFAEGVIADEVEVQLAKVDEVRPRGEVLDNVELPWQCETGPESGINKRIGAVLAPEVISTPAANDEVGNIVAVDHVIGTTAGRVLDQAVADDLCMRAVLQVGDETRATIRIKVDGHSLPKQMEVEPIQTLHILNENAVVRILAAVLPAYGEVGAVEAEPIGRVAMISV